jgi:hypothetical protein
MSNSRTKPVIREARVSSETREADLNSDTDEVYPRDGTFPCKYGHHALARAKIAGFAGIISKHLKELHHGNQA